LSAILDARSTHWLHRPQTPKPQTLRLNETQDPKPETRNPKPETRNPEQEKQKHLKVVIDKLRGLQNDITVLSYANVTND
jgi:hypothetical protein